MDAGASSDRARGALYGLALGDALGMPTQELPRQRALEILAGADRFAAAPDDQRVSRGLPAGTVTDDTEQALLLARLLVVGRGRVDPYRFAEAMLGWEREVAARGSLDLLGPSTKRALEAVAAGADPATTGSAGATDGAAMRVAPVGVAVPVRPLERLLDAVVAADAVTHDTGLAHAGAAAVAAVVSAGVGGAGFFEALPDALEAAAAASRRGHWVAGADVATRIGYAVATACEARDSGGEDLAADLLARMVGTSLATQEAVPAAFGVASVHPSDAWSACRMAAGLGGDCDTIAAMAGAMVGACTGESALPADAVATVRAVNGLDLGPLADALLELRAAG